MGKRSKAELLACNLPQLQNLIKRDPSSYREEFLQQWRHYESELAIFQLKPDSESADFGELITFVSHVANCYRADCKAFPDQVIDLLTAHHQILHADLRKTMVQALILLQNKALLPSTTLLPLFFTLFRCRDKALRKFLHTHIVADIKHANAKAKNNKLNKTMQNYMYTMLRDANDVAAKKSLEVMIDLYKKNVWNEAKTVNIIAEACFSPVSKIAAPAIQFFLGTNEAEGNGEEGDEDADGGINMDSLKHQMSVNKKKKSRATQMEKALASIKRVGLLLRCSAICFPSTAHALTLAPISPPRTKFHIRIEAQKERNRAKAEHFNFSALHLINDPQGFCEKLLSRLRACTANNTFSFELRLCLMNLVSRLIGVHRLLVLSFYDFILSFLKPQQRDVTSILAYVAQSSHDLIPPETMQGVIETIADNFIWNNCASEVITAGLNATREICARCPLAMPPTLLQSLVEDYKSHREKGPMNAARSLITLYREWNPEMLKKKDRGKVGAMAAGSVMPLRYGESRVAEDVDGADLLALAGAGASASDDQEEGEDDDSSDADSDSESEEDVQLESGDEEAGWEEAESEDDDDEEEEEEEEEAGEDIPELVPAAATTTAIASDAKEEGGSPAKRQKTTHVAQERILTAEDFARIKRLKLRRETERLTGIKMAASEDEEEEEDDDDDETQGDDEFVDVSKIMAGIKRKDDYAARMESIREGREGREFGSKKGREDRTSLTNRLKAKRTKAFMMIVHKRGVQGKAKRSLRDKQKVLRAHIKKQKMKK